MIVQSILDTIEQHHYLNLQVNNILCQKALKFMRN